MSSANIFTQIESGDPPEQIKRRPEHPVKRLGITGKSVPLETNKFYANLFLGNQNQPVWTHPYSVQWVKGGGRSKSWGLAIVHIERSQIALEPGKTPSRYYLNPTGIHSVILSAAELGKSTALTTDNLAMFSVNANLAPSATAKPLITYPLLQGLSFITGIYKGCRPLLQTTIFFRTLSGPAKIGTTHKYRLTTEDGKAWLIYITPSSGNMDVGTFKMVDNDTIEGPKDFRGIIQVAKNPDAARGEQVYDKSAGSYANSAVLSGSVNGSTGNYAIRWSKIGTKPLLMFALPHHVQSFDKNTSQYKTGIQLQTTTKGLATAIQTNKFGMVENQMPVDIGFEPWTPAKKSIRGVSSSAETAINDAAGSELGQDMNRQTNLDSMYFSGKGLAKFAFIIFVTSKMTKNTGMASAGLKKLKTAFAVFVNNKQVNPLVYDEDWRGVVSSGGYKDPNVDFGNTNYNDHHFHYGYFVYTAAVIACLDKSWLTAEGGKNKAWVQMLVQDYANSYPNDNYPLFRAFDWYHGHSWAKGLFESGDGKDQESSSEDTFAYYALKMWGMAIGDKNMEARGISVLVRPTSSLLNVK